MLRRAWWNGFRAVTSDEGYKVWLKGVKSGLEYSEGDRLIRVGVERAAGQVDWIIYIGSLNHWMPPHQDDLLSEEKRRQVRKRVLSALDFMKIRYHLAE